MPKTDSSVHNQKVFVTLAAVAQLAAEYKYWEALAEEKQISDPLTQARLEGKVHGYEAVIETLSLPIPKCK
jgi:hypothetical protein